MGERLNDGGLGKGLGRSPSSRQHRFSFPLAYYFAEYSVARPAFCRQLVWVPWVGLLGWLESWTEAGRQPCFALSALP